MRRQLRTDAADVLQPHDHVLWYGDGEHDLYALASEALAAGAARGEKLLFVAEHPDPARLHDAARRREVGDLAPLLRSGQLELLDTASESDSRSVTRGSSPPSKRSSPTR